MRLVTINAHASCMTTFFAGHRLVITPCFTAEYYDGFAQKNADILDEMLHALPNVRIDYIEILSNGALVHTRDAQPTLQYEDIEWKGQYSNVEGTVAQRSAFFNEVLGEPFDGAPPKEDVRHRGPLRRFRYHRGSLEESIATLVESTEEGLAARLLNEHQGGGILTCSYLGYDERTEWNTYLVCVGGRPVGYADGPIGWQDHGAVRYVGSTPNVQNLKRDSVFPQHVHDSFKLDVAKVQAEEDKACTAALEEAAQEPSTAMPIAGFSRTARQGSEVESPIRGEPILAPLLRTLGESGRIAVEQDVLVRTVTPPRPLEHVVLDPLPTQSRPVLEATLGPELDALEHLLATTNIAGPTKKEHAVARQGHNDWDALRLLLAAADVRRRMKTDGS